MTKHPFGSGSCQEVRRIKSGSAMPPAGILGFILLAFMAGCASREKKKTIRERDFTNVTTAPAPISKLPDCQMSLDWSPQPIESVPSIQFAPRGGSQTINVDDVSIEVSPMALKASGDASMKDKYFLECDGLAGEKFRMPAVGRAIRIRIVNDTGHILWFDGSEMQFEDDRGNAVVLDSGVLAGTESPAVEMVSSVFASQRSSLSETRDTTRAEIDKCLPSIGLKEQTRSAVIARLARKVNEEKKRLAEILDEALKVEQEKINVAEKKCLEKAATLRIRPLPYITGTEKPAIRILPGKEFEAYISLARPKGEELPDVLHMRIYDLTTRVDPANRPVRRSHFDFLLRKTTVRADSR